MIPENSRCWSEIGEKRSCKMGDLEALPAVVVLSMLDKLDPASLCSVAVTCRQLRVFVRDVLPRLSSVHVLRDTSLYEHDLASLLANNTTIQSLKLDCSRLVKDTGIDYLIKSSLEELALYNCETLSAELLVRIGQRCASLRSLELELGWQDDRPGHLAYHNGGFSRGLEQLLEGCSLLESLSLSFAGSCFDADALAAIPRLRAGSIRVLDIGLVAERDAKLLLEVRTDGPSHSASPLVQNGYSNLQKLSLSLDRISDSLVNSIALRLPTLTELDLRDEPIEEPLLVFDLTNAGVQQLGGCRSLVRLSIVRKQDWYPAFFKRVSDLGILLMSECCVNLVGIRLGGFSRITDAGCRALLHSSTKLQTFEVLYMSQVTDLAFHDLSATSLALECVGLSSCCLLSDDAIAALVMCQGLLTLNLNGCRSVGDEGLRAISSLSQLSTLSLNYADISDHGLSWLGTSRAPLASLSLRGCQRVTEKGLGALLADNIVNTLKTLDLSVISSLSDDATRATVRSGVRLSELWLRDCPLLTDLSIILLAESGCSDSLRVLDLWGCKGVNLVSATWLKKPNFPRLRWLGVAWTFNVKVAVNLKETRPSLRIRRNGAEFNDWLGGDFVESPSKRGVEMVDELEQWLDEDG